MRKLINKLSITSSLICIMIFSSIIAGCSSGGGGGTNLTCDDVPSNMDNSFFEQNAVTYTGVVDMNPVEKVLTVELTPGGAFCTIDIDTIITGIGQVSGTLMGVISEDGTTCDFAGTPFEVTSPVEISIDIVSGQAILSEDGKGLSLTDFVIIDPNTDEQVDIPDVSCDCESVD
ncbi:MAG: hypothetical protein L0Y68_10010 [Candidatus Dadabacteria bacterium]|nr:hypothetical protein [Candidatus Dadabacteria bacterium]